MDVVDYNSQAWDRQVDEGNQWTRPVSPEIIAAARKGDWSIVLTPTIPVPREWFGDVSGKSVLCLASGGGQQASILATAGAKVSLLDNSQKQLEQDRKVAEREGLRIRLVHGDMSDLSVFSSGEFDLVFNPCSVCFSPNPRQVWKECNRVLKTGGRLMTGLCNPVMYLFDEDKLTNGEFLVRYSIPYSDEELPDDQQQKLIQSRVPFAFGHSFDDLLGGIVDAGLHICGLFEDGFGPGEYEHLDTTIKGFMAVCATKPKA